MGQKRSGANGGAPKPSAQPQAQQQKQPDVTPQPTVSYASNVPKNPTAFTDRDAAAVRAAEDKAYDATTKAAIKMYISNSNFDGDGHSLSQSMNYLLDRGLDFDEVDQATLNQLNRANGTRFTMNDIASMSTYMSTPGCFCE